MAKKKIRKAAKKKSPLKIRTAFTAASWLLLIVAIIGLTARHLLAKSTETTFSDSSGLPAAEQLMSVKTAPVTPEQIIPYLGFTVSFNSRHHIPNWVAWELTATETAGDHPRANNFTSDPDVDGCPDPWDYSYSGYDRGHMAPAGDMKWDAQAMQQSFLLTNICPQAKSLNTGAWKRLEEKCRQRAQADSAIIIVCGPILSDSIHERIGDTRVSVPRRFFKAILSPYANPPYAVGFIMPNASFKGGMQASAVSIDSIEAVTGHDLFAALPDSIEKAIESQCPFTRFSTIPKSKQ